MLLCFFLSLDTVTLLYLYYTNTIIYCTMYVGLDSVRGMVGESASMEKKYGNGRLRNRFGHDVSVQGLRGERT